MKLLKLLAREALDDISHGIHSAAMTLGATVISHDIPTTHLHATEKEEPPYGVRPLKRFPTVVTHRPECYSVCQLDVHSTAVARANMAIVM